MNEVGYEQAKQCMDSQAMPQGTSRYSGRQHFEAIDEAIRYHKLRVNQLEALVRSLPLELPVGASEILAQLVRGA